MHTCEVFRCINSMYQLVSIAAPLAPSLSPHCTAATPGSLRHALLHSQLFNAQQCGHVSLHRHPRLHPSLLTVLSLWHSVRGPIPGPSPYLGSRPFCSFALLRLHVPSNFIINIPAADDDDDDMMPLHEYR